MPIQSFIVYICFPFLWVNTWGCSAYGKYMINFVRNCKLFKGVVWVKWVYEHSSCVTSSPTVGRVSIFYFSHSSGSLWWWDCACGGYSDTMPSSHGSHVRRGTLLQWLAGQLKVKSYWKQALKLMKTFPLPLPSPGTNPCCRAYRMWWLFKN